MKLAPKINPMHCASKDRTRYILNGVKITGNMAVATDGRTLFAACGTRDDEDADRDAIIPTRAAKAAWPQSKRKRGCMLPMITVNPKGEKEPGTVSILDVEFDKTTIKEIEGNYPRFEAVMPDVSKHTFLVGLNVKLLMQIAKCYGEDDVCLHINPDEMQGGCASAAIIVTNSKSPEAVAILMPMRAHGEGHQLASNAAVQDLLARKEAYEAEWKAKAEADALAKLAATPTANQPTA
jgi:DNA polymerase III sliding clamp (beta) subunit (PCNA family)